VFKSLFSSLFLTILFLLAAIKSLPSQPAYADGPLSPAATNQQVTTISPTAIVKIYGGGDYPDAVKGIPFTIGWGDLVTANPASDTTQIVVEASHCNQNELPPPGFKVFRSFIQYDTSAITGTLTGAQLVFSNEEPFVHDGNGRAIHDLMIHQGTWNSTADLVPSNIVPMKVASTTFQAWRPDALAGINFGPITTYPYLAELDIDPSAVIAGGITRLVFRTSAESRVGPLPGSCDLRAPGSGPTAIGNKFTAPLLVVEYASAEDTNRVYLPLILR